MAMATTTVKDIQPRVPGGVITELSAERGAPLMATERISAEHLVRNGPINMSDMSTSWYDPASQTYTYQYPIYSSSGNTVQPTITFPYYPQPMQVVQELPPAVEKEATDLDWLDEQVAEICELAWAA